MSFQHLVDQVIESDKDPSHAKAPSLGQLSGQFAQRLKMPGKMPKLGSLRPGTGRALPLANLRPKLHQGPHAIHGPGDLQPKFRFHSQAIAGRVAQLLSMRSKQKHEVRLSPVAQHHPFAPTG